MVAWLDYWRKYDECMVCGAPKQTPCRDQRWHWKYHGTYRSCQHAHPRRGRLS